MIANCQYQLPLIRALLSMETPYIIISVHHRISSGPLIQQLPNQYPNNGLITNLSNKSSAIFIWPKWMFSYCLLDLILPDDSWMFFSFSYTELLIEMMNTQGFFLEKFQQTPDSFYQILASLITKWYKIVLFWKININQLT